MGGAFLHPGNVTPISEANFYGDPTAANIVLQSIANMYIYPLNVTQYSIITPESTEYIEAKGKAPLVKPLFDHYYYGYYKDALPHLKGAPSMTQYQYSLYLITLCLPITNHLSLS